MPTPELKRRWLRLSPDRFVLSLLLVVGLLWLSERFQWFGFNHHKGWTVLIAVATVGVAALVMLLWWTASLIFRWRFQFGIRSLLVFCLASSIAVSWFAVERQRARRQTELVEWIKNVGARVFYAWEYDAAGNRLPNPEPPGPDWLRMSLGDDFFSAVIGIYIGDITDAGLERIKGLTQLRELYIVIGVTDAGLKQLEGLTELRELNLVATGVTDSGVKKLQQALPNCHIRH